MKISRNVLSCEVHRSNRDEPARIPMFQQSLGYMYPLLDMSGIKADDAPLYLTRKSKERACCYVEI